MAQAARDQNNVPTLLAALNTDGTTPTRVKVSASNHGLEIDDNTTGTDHGVTAAVRDDNNIPVLLAVSSSDGTTPIEIYATSAGSLLIDST